MNVQILSLIEGARKATGVAVIIDVFRAFTVEAYVMSKGAERIIPVGDIDIAYAYKREHPEVILIGERHGKKCKGFDYGNSPSEIEHVDFAGKTVIHTTSAGTQGIANAKNADLVLTGSLTNARAIASYIRSLKPEHVSLVCMGLEGVSETDEDRLCAEYIKSILDGCPMDLTFGIEKLKVTSGAKFFDESQKDVFPEADFHLSTRVDIFPFALAVKQDTRGLPYVERIDMV